MLEFLLTHRSRNYTPQKWSELFGVKVIDPDGWRFTSSGHPPRPWTDEIGMNEFLDRLCSSTANYK
jgi:hypothetical protein